MDKKTFSEYFHQLFEAHFFNDMMMDSDLKTFHSLNRFIIPVVLTPSGFHTLLLLGVELSFPTLVLEELAADNMLLNSSSLRSGWISQLCLSGSSAALSGFLVGLHGSDKDHVGS